MTTRPFLLLWLMVVISWTATAQTTLGGEDRYYHIVWHNDASSFLTETGSVLQVAARSNTARQYWQLLPTDRTHCYYIRNAVSGRYIEACKTSQNNTYNISTQTEPVEYYLSQESAVGGAYRLTSTNCTNYAETSKTPVGLNKNGANSYIITWAAATSNTGSYWDIRETDFDYDYEAVAALGKHSDFAKSAQVYFMPCGTSKSTMCAKSLKVAGSVVRPLDYPCSVWGGSAKKTEAANTSSWWTLYTTDKGLVAPGHELEITVRLGAKPATGYLAQLCFDWDRDGVFEDIHCIDEPALQTLTFTATVPQDARLGESRMRFRITDNGLTGPDEEVSQGQILDCILETVNWSGTLQSSDCSVSVNDSTRGQATVAFVANEEQGVQAQAEALPYGNARFLCWLEGRKVVSTMARYSFALTRPTHLVAVFSVNTKGTESIRTLTSNSDAPYPTPLYYDLSGRLIDTPLKGQTYIRKDTPQQGQLVIYK